MRGVALGPKGTTPLSRKEDYNRILDAAEYWKRPCLLDERSLLSADWSLWTLENFKELYTLYVEKPDESDDPFVEKLRRQLQPGSANAKCLWAEMTWVYRLIVHRQAMKPATKLEAIREVWKWSGRDFPESHELLSDSVLGAGVATPGTAYNTHSWREFCFFVDAMRAWFSLDRSKRESLLGDPWDFAAWLDDTEYAANRMFRHAVLFLLFPDEFESIVSNRQKRQIVERLGTPPEPPDAVAVDRELLAIRGRLEVEHPGFRFYRSPVKELWQEPAPASGNDVTEWPPVRERRASTPSASLNTILYGPPGTGKTYRTFRRCVEICDGRTLEGRELRARYEALVDEGRIRFVTFHQSYGYEEFVEGIRPVEKDGQVVYRVEPGILRTLAKAARHARTVAVPVQVPLHRPFDLVQGEEAGVELATGAAALPHITRAVRTAKYALEGSYRQPKRDSIIDRIYHALRQFGEPMTGDDLVIKVHGFTRPESGKVMAEGAIASTLRWLVQKERLHVVVPANVGAVPRSEAQEPAPPSEPPNFVLVIDEINRANISKVMGELITLLEEDKREGAENEVTVTLPYSREPFALPPNLHILGTMNTADRSIALLDTALRRRFDFEEVGPDTRLLHGARERTGVDLPRVLAAMNERLEYLVDRDHLIGHAWLMRARNRSDLDEIMRRKIIPLIAEYFYDDWNKVRAVLGGTGGFVRRVAIQAPQGLDPDMSETRYRWTIRQEFAEGAYEDLVSGTGTDQRTDD